jgi:hypothetical protein
LARTPYSPCCQITMISLGVFWAGQAQALVSIIMLNASTAPCYQWLAGRMSTSRIHGSFHVPRYTFLCLVYVCASLGVLGIVVKRVNCISLQEIIIYQVRLTISPELLSRSRTAECPEMRFLMDGCYSISRAWWMFSHLARFRETEQSGFRFLIYLLPPSWQMLFKFGFLIFA